jgi:hypothetical protein
VYYQLPCDVVHAALVLVVAAAAVVVLTVVGVSDFG